MKGLHLLFSGIKNNFKQMLPIVSAMTLTIAYAFTLSAFLTKIFMVEATSDKHIWMGAAIGVSVLISICMIFIYSAYFKASAERIRTARVLGARRRDIVLCVVVEAVILYLIGIVLGLLVDVILNTPLDLYGLGKPIYAVGKVFWLSSAITVIVPLIATTVALARHLIANRVFCINR